jgi:hypothetical protein
MVILICDLSAAVSSKFGSLTHHAVEFLLALLDSPMTKYHFSVFKISRFLLKQPGALLYVRGSFQEILLRAHEAVTSDFTSNHASKEAVSQAPSPESTDGERLQIVGAAAELIATAISLFSDEKGQTKLGLRADTSKQASNGLKETRASELIVIPSRSR